MRNPPYLLVLVGALLTLGCGASASDGGAVIANTVCNGEGRTAVAEDGCNLCTCTAKAWSCTTQDCAAAVCPASGLITSGDSDVTWTYVSAAKRCCRFAWDSLPPDSDRTFPTQEDCETGGYVCIPGSIILAGDGCNQCTCDATLKNWVCTSDPCWQFPSPGSGKTCGFFEGGCPSGEYCDFAPIAYCSATDMSGRCTPLPPGCTDDPATVCGCDGNTYGNRCRAAMAGTGVFHMGVCMNAPPARCQKGLTTACTANEYCPTEEGDNCGMNREAIDCANRPTFCGDSINPVCGCNRKVYRNACVAAMAGVGVLKQGACP